MFKIDTLSNNRVDIQVVKGNTFRKQIVIRDDARLAYIPCAADQIIFQVFNKYTDTTPVFEKLIPYDTMILELTAKETARMRINDYVYKIRLIRMNNDVDDVIVGNFIVRTVIEI